MVREIQLPGLTAQLEQEAAQAKEARERGARAEEEKEARKKRRVKEATYLQRSVVAEVLTEAARLLHEGGHGPNLSVTNPEPTGGDKIHGNREDTRPINIRLAWDIRSRPDSRPLVGSDDEHYPVFSWQEVNAEAVRTGGRVKGFRFNVPPPDLYFSASFDVGTSLDEVIAGVDRALSRPLHLDEGKAECGLSPHRGTYNDQDRIKIPFTPQQGK
jgi:hypothetical protein